MAYFLTSEGTHPNTLEKLKDYLGTDYKRKSVIYIPTAANGEYLGAWKDWGELAEIEAAFQEVKVIELENYQKVNISSEILKTDILWIGGGYTGYLAYWMNRLELASIIKDVSNMGMLYVGSSAGSQVMAKTLYAAEIFIGEEEPNAHRIPGLGLIDFEIYPHYLEDLRLEIEDRWKEGYGKLQLLKDGDALLVDNGKVDVLGEDIFL